jgi:pantetheine-phosphate adenylyltransferase
MAAGADTEAGREPRRRIAVYAGSFDPVTNGHVDILSRGAPLFDEVVLAVGHNPAKRGLLTLEQRLDILRAVAAPLPNVRVDVFEGLLVDYCRRIGAMAILRGLRTVTDFEFEFKIGLANRDMAPQVETVFLFTDPNLLFVSSSLVREIAGYGGDVSRYVPEAALEPLLTALGRR